MIKISAVIIAYNEERDIERCIDSLISVTDEILVVDSFSTDRTLEICKSKQVRFEQHKFEGHIEQKNYATGLAIYDYVLSLDADEALSDELKQSIQYVKSNWEGKGYYMNRLNYYCGQWLRHGGWYPDRKLRLWEKNKGKWGGTNPHDKLILLDPVATSRLKGDILHYSYYNLEEHYKQVEYFTDISSKQYYKKGRRSSTLILVVRPVLKFLRDYVLKMGFLDGYLGFVVARISAYANYKKYAKLKKLQSERSR